MATDPVAPSFDPRFAADLSTALKRLGIFEAIPWGDLELVERFWAAVEGLDVDQAVKVARAVLAGIEHGMIKARG